MCCLAGRRAPRARGGTPRPQPTAPSPPSHCTNPDCRARAPPSTSSLASWSPPLVRLRACLPLAKTHCLPTPHPSMPTPAPHTHTHAGETMVEGHDLRRDMNTVYGLMGVCPQASAHACACRAWGARMRGRVCALLRAAAVRALLLGGAPRQGCHPSSPRTFPHTPSSPPPGLPFFPCTRTTCCGTGSLRGSTSSFTGG